MSREMRKYLDTFKQRLTESEKPYISDVKSNELFTLQDLKDAVTISFRWGKPLDWGESPEKFDEEENEVFNEIIKELRNKKVNY